MEITIKIEGKPDEFQEIFSPSDRQAEFMEMTYDAYCEALKQLLWKQIDPRNLTGCAKTGWDNAKEGD